jgi:tRNA nucleotidyltransferase (CCA-adding enzyme)
MVETLRACGALARILPELDALWGVPQRADYHPEIDTGVHVLMVIDMSARLGQPLPARFGALTHDLGKAGTPADVLPRHSGHEERSVDLLGPLCGRLRVPVECRDVALLTARHHGVIHKIGDDECLRPATIVKLLENCDALRRPQRFDMVLDACEADYRGRRGREDSAYPQAARWRAALAAVRAVAAGDIARACNDPGHIAERIHAARIEAVKGMAA